METVCLRRRRGGAMHPRFRTPVRSDLNIGCELDSSLHYDGGTGLFGPNIDRVHERADERQSEPPVERAVAWLPCAAVPHLEAGPPRIVEERPQLERRLGGLLRVL